MSKKQLFLDNVDDLVANLLYYDRKNDEELSEEDVEELLKTGVVTKEEIIKVFTEALIEALEDD